jgi:hypothetical protein
MVYGRCFHLSADPSQTLPVETTNKEESDEACRGD